MFSSSKKETPPPRCIGLLSDFGLVDPYVGQIKGVLAKKVPNCTVVDISHDVVPFNVAQAGFFLAASFKHFPKDAIFLAVVDPGVGTDRRIVCLQIGERLLVAPDNGLLSLALRNSGDEHVRAFDLSAAMNAPKDISHTFHGRDVFAPLAAWLAMGGDPGGLGEEIDPGNLVSQQWSQPTTSPGRATAHVLHIDRFGNCVLNLEAGSISSPESVRLAALSTDELPCVSTYGDLGKGSAGLLEGSQGYLEIAVNQHSAADKFGLSMNDEIELTWEA